MDMATFSAGMKTLYSERGRHLQMTNRPALAYLAKKGKFVGDGLALPAVVGSPENVSSDFAESQARADVGSTALAKFVLTRVKLYNIVNIDRETMLAADGKDGSFWDAQTLEVDRAINAVASRLESAIFRSGWGDLGKVGTSTGATITLANPTDAYNFRRNMRVVFSATLNSSVLRGTSPNQYLQVLSANANTGVITFTANVSTITGGGGTIANGDTIFSKADRQDTVSPVAKLPAGFEAWAPMGGPTSASFFGVDRTTYPQELGGISVDGTSDTIEEAINEASMLMAEQEQTPTHAFMNYRAFGKILNNAKTLQRFVDKVDPVIGFESARLGTPGGTLTMVPSAKCPANRVFLVNKDSVKLYYLGKEPIHLVEDVNSGSVLLTRPTADGYEVRVSFIGNLGTPAPAAIANIAITPA
jgi:hypothetical protein